MPLIGIKWYEVGLYYLTMNNDWDSVNQETSLGKEEINPISSVYEITDQETLPLPITSEVKTEALKKIQINKTKASKNTKFFPNE